MKYKNILTGAFFIFICQMAGIIGSFFTYPSVRGWYQGIIRPSFSPPNWIFAPVWTILFALMGIAVSMIWLSEKNELRKKAVKVFFYQLFLNTMWSIIFFGMKNPTLAFVEIVILWFSILYTIILFKNIKPTAAYLLIPYILWVSFASVLNLAIALLN